MFSVKDHHNDEKMPILEWKVDPELMARSGRAVASNDWERKALFCTICGETDGLQLSFILKVRWKITNDPSPNQK